MRRPKKGPPSSAGSHESAGPDAPEVTDDFD